MPLTPKLILIACLVGTFGVFAESDLERPTRDYYVYVCAESDDTVSLVRFGPDGIEQAKSIEVGSFPAETEGPHGINVSPDGRFWYVSISHGQPFGSIHKYSTGDDEWQGDAKVGMFPATLSISPSTGLLYVVNSDFYGDHVPSTISVVETSTMTEVEQIATGTMPHGSRLSSDGKKLYSVNMMDDELVEVDALRFEISRRLKLGDKPAAEHGHQGHEGHGGATTNAGTAAMAMAMAEPSWVTEPTRDGKIYVPALSGARIYEVDVDSFEITRTFESAKGPYNAAVTPDGKLLVVTYKKSDAVGFWDLETGEEVARIDTTRRIPHGVAITPDGRYSFVTVEGIGGEPGLVEVFDNQALQRVAQLEIGKQAGGLAVWQGPR
jgi:DNA-binding beta-propeller fold protein YncE